MKISLLVLALVAAVDGNKVPALRSGLAVTSDGTPPVPVCMILPGSEGSCNRNAPHYDPQGMVCGNDGQDDEAYCNYNNGRVDASACVIGRCDLDVDEVCSILAGSEGSCDRNAPHYDPQGMVCGNDGQDDEAYCNYNNYRVDASACVIGRCDLDVEEVCSILAGSEGSCDRNAPHYDPQGMVCGNNGQDNEAYCNFNNGRADASACLIGRCDLTPEEVYNNQWWYELPSAIRTAFETVGFPTPSNAPFARNWNWWDADLRPDDTYKYWTELTAAQQTAMVSVGYTQRSWDNSEDDAGNCTPTSDPWCTRFTNIGCEDDHWCTWTPWSEGFMN